MLTARIEGLLEKQIGLLENRFCLSCEYIAHLREGANKETIEEDASKFIRLGNELEWVTEALTEAYKGYSPEALLEMENHPLVQEMFSLSRYIESLDQQIERLEES